MCKSFWKCPEIFNQNPGSASRKEIIEAGETAILCLNGAKFETKLQVIRFTSNHKFYNLPTSDSCQHHSLRVYFQITQWKGISEGMDVLDYGWEVRNSVLKPVKTNMGPAPHNMLKTVRCGYKSGCKTAICTCRKLGIECNLMCRNCRDVGYSMCD